MRRTLWMLVVPALGALALAGCGGDDDGGGGGVQQGGEIGSEAAVKLEEVNNSNEFGTASLFEEEGKVRVLMDTEGPFDREFEQPAEILKGSCPEPTGQPVHELNVLQDGVSETTLNVTLADLQAGGLVIVVRKSPMDETITECGPIPPA
jgi:hypothetical protein